MERPLVSIVMPAYNAGKYIGRAIESVLAQTYDNWELIIVDDGSTDNTYEVASRYKDPRIRILRHDKNMGTGPSRNDALSASRGQWIAVLDADDEWLPRRLERLLPEALEADDIFVSDLLTLCFDNNGNLIPWKIIDPFRLLNRKESEKITTLEEFLKVGTVVITPIFPSFIIRHFRLRFENFRMGQDLDFWIQLFHTGLKLKIVGESYYLYRLTPGSASSSLNPDLLAVQKKWIIDKRTSPTQRQLWLKLNVKTEERLRYEPFAKSLKQRDFARALSIAIKDPRVLITFVKGIPSVLSYRLAALKAGARPR